MERVDVRIPEALIEKTDVAATITNKSRTEIVAEALRVYLDDIEEQDDFREAVIDHYLTGEIEFDVLSAFIGRQDADAVRSSKHLLEQGEEIAEAMDLARDLEALDELLGTEDMDEWRAASDGEAQSRGRPDEDA